MPPSDAPAAATAPVMALIPASNSITPSPSRIRYTFIVLLGKPPRTTQTPSATGSGPLARRRLTRVVRLNALAIRSSVVEPCGGSAPSWRASSAPFM